MKSRVYKHPKKAFVGALLALVLVGFAIWKASYENYCFAQKRFLKDRELFETVIRDAFWSVMSGKNDFSKSDISSNPDEASIQIDNTIEEFLGENPNCCRVMADGDNFISEGWFRLSMWGRLTGSQSYIVEVKFNGDPQSELYDISTSKVVYRTIGACGNIYRYF